MTLKDHKNHYNVKLLRGYGVSINLKNNRIILKNGQHDITGKSETEEYFVTRMPYEKIVISGRGYVSTGNAYIIMNWVNQELAEKKQLGLVIE
jgi:CRISPR-associated protein Cas1